ncbi:hypothetical protein I4U23_029865 [Adineta vaga]|nr:hypothetical protein I4U23_029865 [Adineta vaga]
MQFVRRFSFIRSSFRYLSLSKANVNSSTTQHELSEIQKLMKNYNNSNESIRTLALFEWMVNIIHVKPDFSCYLHIIRAGGEINNFNFCQKIQESIEKDQRLDENEYYELQIKLIYMFGKIKRIDLAEQIFYRLKRMKNQLIQISLYGTMFKGYNMNGLGGKTIELYENDLCNNKIIELDAVTATCILSACSDCHRLDIGKSVHDELIRLKLLDSSNIRLVTALMDMYCKCNLIDRARELFDQHLPKLDHVAYSALMKAYLTKNQPDQVLSLFNQLQSSSISPDVSLYLHVINAVKQLGVSHQAENIHRSIPSYIIEKNLSIQMTLIDMHTSCSNFDEAQRLYRLLKRKE